MKKGLIILLMLCVLFCTLPVLASGEGETEKFLFREKITWDMNVEEVTGLEEGEYTENEVNQLTIVLYRDVSVSKYSAQLAYVFADDSLVSCVYGILDPDDEMAAMMKKALTSVYGDEAEVTPEEMSEVAYAMSGDAETAYDLEGITFSKWACPDGTNIYLIREEGLLEIMYTAPDYLGILLEPAQEDVDVTGL